MSTFRSAGSAASSRCHTYRRLTAVVMLLLSITATAVFAAPASAGASPAPDTAAPAAGATAGATTWKTVLEDRFDDGILAKHWRLYSGRYGSGKRSCALPSHNTVSGGYLHLKFSYEASPTTGECGAAWYSGGMSLDPKFSAVSQRVTVRFRVVQTGGVSAHRIIPMRWPDVSTGAKGGGAGEEDMCEGDALDCSTFLHHADLNRTSRKHVVDLSQWHTFQFTRAGFTMNANIDGKSVWNFAGDANSLPATLKHVVLQQECYKTACPLTKVGKEDIQIDWIRVENPA